jgi:uncharacterized protein YoxC
LFTAAADLSETVSDLNGTGRKIADTIKGQVKNTGKILTLSVLVRNIFNVFNFINRKKSRKKK